MAYMRNEIWRDEISIWQDAVRKSPNKARPNYYLGIVYDKFNETEKALQYISRAREIDPEIITKWLASSYSSVRQTKQADAQGKANSAMDATHQIMLASSYIEKGNYDQARLIIDGVLGTDPAYTAAYLALARIYNILGQTDKEDETYSTAMARGKASPPMDMVYINQGLIYGKQGKYEESVALFKQALKIRNSYEAHYNLSVSYNSMGLYENAAREYREALSLK